MKEQQSFDFKNDTFNVTQDDFKKLGIITEYDRLRAGKQILLGLAVLYVMTLIAYVWAPQRGTDLIEITKMVFPPLATLIIAFYFRDSKGV